MESFTTLSLMAPPPSLSLDESLSQLRDPPAPPAPPVPLLLPHHFRIPPLREPVPSRILKVPSPLEPSTGSLNLNEHNSNIPPKATTASSSTSISVSSSAATTAATTATPATATHPPAPPPPPPISNVGNNNEGNPPTELPTLADFLNAARSDKLARIYGSDAPSSLEPAPKPILPFINLRTVENLPYPFDEEAPRKRARLDVQQTTTADGFGEHLHLPVPKIHKEASKPRPFGPLTILNGLNEPPPNAALFPPIETDSTPTNILTRPTRDATAEVAASNRTRSNTKRQKITEIIEPVEEEVLLPEVGMLRGFGNIFTREVATLGGESGTGPTLQPQQRSQSQALAPSLRSQTQLTTEEKLQEAEDTLQSGNQGTARKKLRRWTEQETRDLLRGVIRCGVGNWTAIIRQPDLKFSQRTAGNLKDRFRVCCPWAYDYEESMGEAALKLSLAETASKPVSDLDGKIVLPDPRKTSSGQSKDQSNQAATVRTSLRFAPTQPSSSAADEESRSGTTTTVGTPVTSLTKKGGTSTSKGSEELSKKSQLTLLALGMQDPQNTVRSRPRLRRPFNAEEDQALLRGYMKHGFQWTLIQQDTDLGLAHRRATVLRDRFRTKFPGTYKDGGAATILVEDDGKGIIGLGLDSQSSSNPSSSLRNGILAPQPHLQQHRHSIQNPPIQNQNRNHNPNPKTNQQQQQHKRGQRSLTTLLESAIPVDPVMSPPAPPSNVPDFSKSLPNPLHNSLSPFSIVVDDGGATGGDNLRWADNTLPPPVWDDMR